MLWTLRYRSTMYYYYRYYPPCRDIRFTISFLLLQISEIFLGAHLGSKFVTTDNRGWGWGDGSGGGGGGGGDCQQG